MDKTKLITDTELEKMLVSSARSLPDSPSEKGMRPAQIKRALYEPIRQIASVLNLKLSNYEDIEKNKNSITDFALKQIESCRFDADSRCIVFTLRDKTYMTVPIGELTEGLARLSETASSLDAEWVEMSDGINPFKLRLSVKSSTGKELSARTVDFPLEQLVVSGEYVHADKTILLMLKDGSSISIPVGDLVKGLLSYTESDISALDIADESGNLALRIKENGHIETRAFDSESAEEKMSLCLGAEDSGDALAFTDACGNAILRVKENGHIESHSFDSESANINEAYEKELNTLRQEKELCRCDYGKEMKTGISYFVEGDVIVCRCVPAALEGGIINIFTAVGSGVARGSASFVNFETGVMGMYGGISSTSSTLNIRYSKRIGFTLTQGHEYVIEMMKRGKEHTVRITDAYTLKSDALTVMPTGSSDIGEHWGKRSYTASGQISVTSFKNYCLQPYECRLLIIGDSFIEGATGFESHADRYCARMKRLLNGSCAISGFGGATTEQVSAFYEAYCKTLFKPQYVLIACGTNNSSYSSWLTAEKSLIASIKESGAIPILVTVTRRLDKDNLSFIRQANAWIRDESGEMYIDINRITTEGYDGETQNSALFADDTVHPLPGTHALIVKRALIDIPEVFNISSSYIDERKNYGGNQL